MSNKKEHRCKEDRNCCCSVQALKPNEDCPLHGYPRPPRCGECGQFMSYTEGEETNK